MLDDRDIAFDHTLDNIDCRCRIKFYSVAPSIRAYGIDSLIQKISFGRSDLANRPVISADIVRGRKLAILIGVVGIHELTVFVDAVCCSGQRSIALRCSGLHVGLCNGHAELFQIIAEALFGDAIPFDGSRLIVRDYVTDRCIDFLKCVAVSDQNILEHRRAAGIRDSVLINGKAAEGGSVKMKLNAFHKPVLGSLGDFEVSALQDIVKRDGSCLTADNGNPVGFLRLVTVVALFRYGIGSRHEVLNEDLAICVSCHGLVHTFPCNGKSKTGHNTVLGCFDNLCGTVAHHNLQEGLYGIADRCGVGDSVLMSALMLSVTPGNETGTCLALRGGNDHRFLGSSCRCNGQFVPVYAEVHTGHVGSKGILREDVVGIGERGGILAAVPFKLDLRSTSGALFHETRNDGMTLHAGNDTVIVFTDLTIKRMSGSEHILNRVIAARAHMVKVSITFTHDRFPYKDLSGIDMSDFVRVLCILGTPGQGKITMIPVLKDSAKQQLDIIRLNGVVQIARIVVPEILTEARHGFTYHSVDSRFDAVDNLSVISIHAMDCHNISIMGVPAIHVRQGRMAPSLV